MSVKEQRTLYSTERSLKAWYRLRGTPDLSVPRDCVIGGCDGYTRGRYCADHFPKGVS
jgi:hypothetical protein